MQRCYQKRDLQVNSQVTVEYVAAERELDDALTPTNRQQRYMKDKCTMASLSGISIAYLP